MKNLEETIDTLEEVSKKIDSIQGNIAVHEMLSQYSEAQFRGIIQEELREAVEALEQTTEKIGFYSLLQLLIVTPVTIILIGLYLYYAR